MALFLPVILVAVLVVIMLQHRGRETRLRRHLNTVTGDLTELRAAIEAGRDPAAIPEPEAGLDTMTILRAPHHVHAAVTEAYGALDRGDADAAAVLSRCLQVLDEYREFRGWT